MKTGWVEDVMTAQEKIDGLNHAETQYAAMVELIDTTYHDDRYYPIAESDAKFYPKAGGREGMNAKYLSGYTLAELQAMALPSGIVMWTAGNLRTGWSELTAAAGCFLSANIPSLREGTGGSNTATTAGTVTVADHTLTVLELPAHNHGWLDRSNPVSSIWSGGTGGWAHAHPGSTVDFEDVLHQPYYYVFRLIKKVS